MARNRHSEVWITQILKESEVGKVREVIGRHGLSSPPLHLETQVSGSEPVWRQAVESHGGGKQMAKETGGESVPRESDSVRAARHRSRGTSLQILVFLCLSFGERAWVLLFIAVELVPQGIIEINL